MARGHRPRPLRVEDAARGRNDAKRLERAGVVRYPGRNDALEREGGIGETIICDHIDAERTCLRRSAEIDGDVRIADRQPRREPYRLVITVQYNCVVPAPFREFGDRGLDDMARATDDCLADGVKTLQSKLVERCD